jgi:multidrug efflux pump subunit AcrB
MKKERKFWLSNFAVDNIKTVYIFLALIVFAGIYSYTNTPKEQFPEVSFPYFSVVSVYPGTSPSDMENLVTYPIEQQIRNIDGVKHVTSKSSQDVSIILVEFETYVEENQALIDTRDAVSKAKSDLPDLPEDPDVMQMDMSQIPVLYINLSGDMALAEIKSHADNLQNHLEGLGAVSRVDIVGALNREIQINVDLAKMQAAGVSFDQISNIIRFENMTIAGGEVDMDNFKRSLRVVGEIKDPLELENVMVKPGVYLKDIAEVKDDFEERKSYARLSGEDVITLNVIKRNGENLIECVDNANAVIDEYFAHAPQALDITTTGDMSKMTRDSVSNLFNTIILGFIVVAFVLMFFMGVDNAGFAALAVPISILIAFIVIPLMDFTINWSSQMALIVALGILVDNSIVVVESIYRHYMNTPNLPIVPASKRAVGEVAIPILAGTTTTLAPFVVLSFWPGIMGQFIREMPITLSITLVASLFVAYVINPAFAVSFMKYRSHQKKTNLKKRILWTSIAVLVSAAFYVSGFMVPGNLIAIGLIVFYFVQLMKPLIKGFQNKVLPALQNWYERRLNWVMKKGRPAMILGGAVALFFTTIMLYGVFKPETTLMPPTDPSQIYVYVKMPAGTGLEKTNEVVRIIEEEVDSIMKPYQQDIDFINSSVAVNAGKSSFENSAPMSHLGRVTIGFKDYQYRTGEPTSIYLDIIRKGIKPIPAADIIVEEQQMGPPTGSPINIEIKGDDLFKLTQIEAQIRQIIQKYDVRGIEKLDSDLEKHNPEIIVNVDRAKANELDINTAMIGNALRTAIYGSEVSNFRQGEDEYPIMVRLEKETRDDIEALMNMKVGISPNLVPISAVADVEYVSSYGGIIRRDYKRTNTLSSNVLEGYNAINIIRKLDAAFASELDLDEGYTVEFTGEQENIEETMSFLTFAILISIALIFLILVSQFNSIGKPGIVLTQVVLSLIGVFLGTMIFNMPFSLFLSGLGIIAVGGIVVNNGILLIDYTDNLRKQGMPFRQAIVEAGKTRLTPVLLTAFSTILGLLPLALGINIDFIGLLTDFNPNFYWGGDSSQFWGPMAWTIIFGLSFATLLTLLVVPAMYYVVYKKRVIKKGEAF